MRARTTMTGLALTAGLALSHGAGGAGLGRRTQRRPRDDVGRQPQGGHHQGRAAARRGLLDAGADEERHPGRQARSTRSRASPAAGQPAGTAVLGDTPSRSFGKVFFTERQLQLRLLRHRDQQQQRRRRHRPPATASTRVPATFVTNFAFVPGLQQQRRGPTAPGPPGRCSPPTQWKNGEDYDYDAAFAVMNTNAAGQTLTDSHRWLRDRLQPAARSDHEGLRLPGRQAVQRSDSSYSCTGVVVAGHLRRQPGPGPRLQHDRRVLRRRLDPEWLPQLGVDELRLHRRHEHPVGARTSGPPIQGNLQHRFRAP